MGGGAQHGRRRVGEGSSERGGEGFKPRIPERVGRWPEGEEESAPDWVELSLATVRAAVCIGPEHAREGVGRGRSRRIEAGPAGGQVFGAAAIGEEAIVPDPHEAFGEHVEGNRPMNSSAGRRTSPHFVLMSSLPQRKRT